MPIQSKIDSILSRHPGHKGYALNVSHDGFDGDGDPESDLYDLFVWENNEIFEYHYENWFTVACAEEEFELVKQWTPKQFFAHNLCGVRPSDFRL